MKRITITSAAVFIAAATAATPRWSVEKAKAWAAANPWWCGVNYIPANAINYTAMWDKTNFSPDVMRRELALMAQAGMNCVRFVMQYKVWEDDRETFLRNLDEFFSICDEAKVKAMPIFFDDCAFGANRDPVAGRQPEPLEGWYAWGLVNGKTQTHLPWEHRPEKLPFSGVWQHDLYRDDFTPYDPAEIATLRETILRKNPPPAAP